MKSRFKTLKNGTSAGCKHHRFLGSGTMPPLHFDRTILIMIQQFHLCHSYQNITELMLIVYTHDSPVEGLWFFMKVFARLVVLNCNLIAEPYCFLQMLFWSASTANFSLIALPGTQKILSSFSHLNNFSLNWHCRLQEVLPALLNQDRV